MVVIEVVTVDSSDWSISNISNIIMCRCRISSGIRAHHGLLLIFGVQFWQVLEVWFFSLMWPVFFVFFFKQHYLFTFYQCASFIVSLFYLYCSCPPVQWHLHAIIHISFGQICKIYAKRNAMEWSAAGTNTNMLQIPYILSIELFVHVQCLASI